MKRIVATARRYAICALALLAVVLVNRWIVPVNATTVALYMLLVVLGAATTWGLPEGLFTSVAGMLAFNFFFLPPVGTFTISDPQNWVAFFSFVATAVTASQLSARAKRRAEEALAGRNEISGLYELSRALLMDETGDAVRNSVLRAAQILKIRELAFYDVAEDQIYGSVENSGLLPADLARTAKSGDTIVRAEASVVPVRMGTQIIGSLAVAGNVSERLRDSIANLLAINYERTHAVARAATAEIARRNEEVRQELLSIIDQESTRLQASITEAIELARIESHELHLAPEMTDIAKLVEMAVMEGRDENLSRYTLEIPAGLEVLIDPDLFRRALLQILENARKYAPPGSPIVVRAQRDVGGTTIAVLDRGSGISSDEMERIFDKFYRGRKGRQKTEGTGMGLAIAKAIVTAHQGRIYAENRAGGGAAIIIRLP